MRELELVDALYETFAQTLHGALPDEARRLAYTLGLAPSHAIPWSQVFGHEVTLAAPALLADAMPDVRHEAVRDAVLAHMLAVIEAFGTDRIEDGQVQTTPALLALLGQARRHRDRALRRICGASTELDLDFAAADRTTLHAIGVERDILRSKEGTDFETYERVSLAKQSVGFPASLALAHAAGWDARTRRVLRELLASVWLGLQMHDDVVDWEDDWGRGGAWAVALAQGQYPSERLANAEHHVVRARVYASKVLERMLARSRWHFHSVRRRAMVLGAGRLAAWAASREAKLDSLVSAEARHAGYAVRAHALAAWANEVLA